MTTPREKELESRVAALQSQVNYMWSEKEKLFDKDYVLERDKTWVVGITRRSNGSFSSVWMMPTEAFDKRALKS